jgi:hypothetical protein
MSEYDASCPTFCPFARVCRGSIAAVCPILAVWRRRGCIGFLEVQVVQVVGEPREEVACGRTVATPAP